VDAAYFRLKAARCRRLAASIVTRDDPAIASLSALSAQCESDADALEGMAAVAAPDAVEQTRLAAQRAE
jgi:hypothetical protein